MTEVNAEEFRARIAERLLGRGLAAVEASANATPRLKTRFAQEASEWRSSLRGRGSADRNIARSWSGITPATADYLDLLLERSDDEWRTWVRFARRVTDDVADIIVDATDHDVTLPAADRATVAILSVASRYDLELPNTPARWRSLTGIRHAQPTRKKEIDSLVEESLSYIEGRANADVPARGYRSGDRFAHGSSAGSGKHSAYPKRRMHVRSEELLDQFKELTLVELAEFVKSFEQTFEVTAATPVAVAAASSVPANGMPGGEAEKDSFDVILEAAGDKKIQVIKVVRELTSLGLGEAKAVVDSAPNIVLEAATKKIADVAKAALEDAGARVTLK